MSGSPSIVVVGSVNLDLVASVSRLPVAGETVSGAELNRYPGGKGANQALAAKRLGADVSMVARVGDDAAADEALALLQSAGVNMAACGRDADAATGIALIVVTPSGENQIVVAPGANRRLRPDMLDLPAADALICQLEIPIETLLHASRVFDGFFCINLAPALEVPAELIQRADLVVVNETEAAWFGNALAVCDGLLATTYGADGAVLKKSGEILAEAKPPQIDAVDATGAGDAFTAAMTVAIVEGQEPDAALRFACAAGAAAAKKAGAQPSLPFRKDVEDLMKNSQEPNPPDDSSNAVMLDAD
ncbi:MAG: ribokinase [Proteobacteria bacterium]|nr:ribokinase [Pseudomonadota bacterium]